MLSANEAAKCNDIKQKKSSGLESLFTCEKHSLWSDAQHWKKLCSSLTIDVEEKAQTKNETEGWEKLCQRDADEVARRRERLVEDGYVLADDLIGGGEEASDHSMLIKRLKTAIATLHEKHGYPATFIFLYDQAWELARIAKRNLSASTHSSNEFNFDLLAWYVNPRENVAGFSPHRDRQSTKLNDRFHNDHQAKYVTMWMALSDATPENSCLYVIPKQYDPGYTAGDDIPDEEGGGAAEKQGDPLSRALSSKESFQNIRALPRQTGQSVLFTGSIMHWGSRGNPKSHLKEPRIAISFVSSDPKFERPYISPKHFTEHIYPPFRIRLLLVCSQLLIYYQRFDLPKECVRACYEYCKEHGDELDETYRHKVFVEFVKAMKEATCDNASEDVLNSAMKGSVKEFTHSPVSSNQNGSGEVVDDEDDEDAMLEEMLDAEAGGYGEFEDDYDEHAANKADNVDAGDDAKTSSEEEESGIFFGKHELQDGDRVIATRKRKGSP